jgi:ribosomal protein L7/L12
MDMHQEQEIRRLRARVTHLEQQVKALMEKQGMGYSGPSEDAMPREVHELASKGEKVEAIRLYMELTGTTLKEAKEAVEELG